MKELKFKHIDVETVIKEHMHPEDFDAMEEGGKILATTLPCLGIIHYENIEGEVDICDVWGNFRFTTTARGNVDIETHEDAVTNAIYKVYGKYIDDFSIEECENIDLDMVEEEIMHEFEEDAIKELINEPSNWDRW